MTPSNRDVICIQETLDGILLVTTQEKTYVNSRLVGLDLTYLVELLDPRFRLHEPLYDLNFLDTLADQP